jgi:hypothetical protein
MNNSANPRKSSKFASLKSSSYGRETFKRGEGCEIPPKKIYTSNKYQHQFGTLSLVGALALKKNV